MYENLTAKPSNRPQKSSAGTALSKDAILQKSLSPELELELQALRLLLVQKDTLMREVNHRVKNNFQMVSSLLRMQADLLEDPDAVAGLRAMEHRVLSMAIIQEQLCGEFQADRIDFQEYTHALVKELFQSYAAEAGDVTSCLKTSPVSLKTDQAIPCSLILNELVTNALKYAYMPGQKGEIAVELSETAGGVVSLSVSDHGPGLPEALDWRNSSSLGLPIVDLLVKQLRGNLTVQSRPGTAFKIEFHK